MTCKLNPLYNSKYFPLTKRKKHKPGRTILFLTFVIFRKKRQKLLFSFVFEGKKRKTLCLLTKKWSYEITLGQFSSTISLVFILQLCIKVQYLFKDFYEKKCEKKIKS